MNNWIRLLISFAVVLFLFTNMALIEKKGSKVSRINYIPEWSRVKKADIRDSFTVNGIIKQADTEYIKLDKDAEFEEFLVNEHDYVEEGTPLFSYKSDAIDRREAQLETEIQSLESKRDSVLSAIDELQSLTPPSTGGSDNSYDYDYDDEEDRSDLYDPFYDSAPNNEMSESEWQLKVDQAIMEKNLEAEKIDADIRKLEEQKSSLQSERDQLTVESPISGLVKDLSHDLKNPVVTIVSNDLVLEGKLSEEQLGKVEEGMEVHIYSRLTDGRLKGNVSKVTKHPDGEPDLESSSYYPFIAEFDEEAEELNVGFHVKAELVTDEARNVPAVFEKNIGSDSDTDYIWVLKQNGWTDKRKIQTGLEVGGLYEVEKGLKGGEYYATDYRYAVKQAPFITSLHIHDLQKSAFKGISGKKTVKYILIGVLQQ